MKIEHLPATTSHTEVKEILKRDGCVILDGVLDGNAVKALTEEMSPHLAEARKGQDEFSGPETRRIGSLIARSPSSHKVIAHPTILKIVAGALSHAPNYQLHLTQIIAVGPGSRPQIIHRDQWAFNKFPFPTGFEATFATMWALTDFTEGNGATRVVPGSHKMDDRQKFSMEDTIPAEMTAGSVLLYVGSLYHGAGANTTETDRIGLNIDYTLGWLRQEENQYLGVPKKVLDELSEDLLRLMGYAIGSYSLGYIDGGRDSIAAVRPEFEKTGPPAPTGQK